MLVPWVVRSVWLPSCSSHLSAFKCRTASCHLTYPVLLQPPCHTSSPPQLPISAPPTSLDKCFFFNSLVVRLPYSSIFWQFWLFFVFKLVVVLLLVVQGGKVDLPVPPSWLEVFCLFLWLTSIPLCICTTSFFLSNPVTHLLLCIISESNFPRSLGGFNCLGKNSDNKGIS